MENTTENNKLLAEFMVFDFTRFENDGIIEPNYGTFFKYVQSTFTLEELKFDSDWNWLMEVVHKCLEICNNEMLNEWEIGFSDAFFSMDIVQMYKESISFVKWNNEQNK